MQMWHQFKIQFYQLNFQGNKIHISLRPDWNHCIIDVLDSLSVIWNILLKRRSNRGTIPYQAVILFRLLVLNNGSDGFYSCLFNRFRFMLCALPTNMTTNWNAFSGSVKWIWLFRSTSVSYTIKYLL